MSQARNLFVLLVISCVSAFGVDVNLKTDNQSLTKEQMLAYKTFNEFYKSLKKENFPPRCEMEKDGDFFKFLVTNAQSFSKQKFSIGRITPKNGVWKMNQSNKIVPMKLESGVLINVAKFSAIRKKGVPKGASPQIKLWVAQFTNKTFMIWCEKGYDKFILRDIILSNEYKIDHPQEKANQMPITEKDLDFLQPFYGDDEKAISVTDIPFCHRWAG